MSSAMFIDKRTARTLATTKYFQSAVLIIFKEKEEKYFSFQLRPQMVSLKYMMLES